MTIVRYRTTKPILNVAVGELWFDTSTNTLRRFDGVHWQPAQTPLAVEEDDQWVRDYDDGQYMILREPNTTDPKYQIIKDRRLYGLAKDLTQAVASVEEDKAYQANLRHPAPKIIPDHYGGW